MIYLLCKTFFLILFMHACTYLWIYIRICVQGIHVCMLLYRCGDKRITCRAGSLLPPCVLWRWNSGCLSKQQATLFSELPCSWSPKQNSFKLTHLSINAGRAIPHIHSWKIFSNFSPYLIPADHVSSWVMSSYKGIRGREHLLSGDS